MRIATWNINDIRKRLPLLLAWLEATRPDVVALQELKCADDSFPAEALAHMGYHALVVGQKTWNGVALLSLDHEPIEIRRALPGDPADSQARYVEAAIRSGPEVRLQARLVRTPADPRARLDEVGPPGGAGRRLQRRADR